MHDDGTIGHFPGVLVDDLAADGAPTEGVRVNFQEKRGNEIVVFMRRALKLEDPDPARRAEARERVAAARRARAEREQAAQRERERAQRERERAERREQEAAEKKARARAAARAAAAAAAQAGAAAAAAALVVAPWRGGPAPLAWQCPLCEALLYQPTQLPCCNLIIWWGGAGAGAGAARRVCFLTLSLVRAAFLA